jgi:YidC/Oxa1 family membrane protein insertase
MNFDRNTIIGFVVLAVLFIGYFFYTTREQQAYQRQKAIQDSIANANKPKVDSNTVRLDAQRADSFRRVTQAGGFAAATQGAGQVQIVETDLFKIGFTSKGGQPELVELKQFKGPDSANVKLAATAYNNITYPIVTAPNQTANVSDLNFTALPVQKDASGNTVVVYQLQSGAGQAIEHRYTLKPGNYMIDFDIVTNGASQLLGNTLNLTWQNEALQQQKDLVYEKGQSQICFRVEGDYDDYNIQSRTEKELEDPVEWVGVKQQFFNSTILARKGSFSSANLQWTTPSGEKTNTVVQSTANLKMKLQAGQNASVPLALYYGPNDYKILKKYDNDMENMVNLGSGMFAFVKYINRWLVIPAFDLFKKVTTNYGIVILLLTLVIRLLISPLTYSSYLSGAKMKVLRPEIEQLKAKYGTDQQAISMEQMKLFREAGVNPLGGCIPALLQIPIFFALYSFFNSSVDLRGQSFLWADDLSQYDSILDLPFRIPIYGDHVSLFTITAVITSLLISLYSMSMTPDQGNPVLKYMPYFFPFILLFVFNPLPSGLTWYYTVSNIITLALQFVIQNYIINHDKILAKMEENRKKPRTKSKWQERFEQMQEQQKKMQDVQQRGRK